MKTTDNNRRLNEMWKYDGSAGPQNFSGMTFEGVDYLVEIDDNGAFTHWVRKSGSEEWELIPPLTGNL